MKSTIKFGLKVSSASVVLGVALMASSAFAQDAGSTAKKGDNEASTIIVTGSIVRNKSAATASPVTSITATDLSDRGITSVADAVQELTANNAGTDPSSWSPFGFATGASAPSLRGLNDAYTLTIFNGLRSAPYPLADDGYRNFVDINTIPESIVQSIDVLQDGASSTYGADAIAGVVNVIIKREVKGLHLNMENGISQHGDAGERRLDATWGIGKLSENGYNFYVNAEYQKNDALFMNSRGFPYGTSDLSSICDSSGSCMYNGVRNGIQANGSYGGFTSTTVPFVRPYTSATTPASLGGYQLLNPSAGCQDLTPVTLTAAQRAGTITPATVCQQDDNARYFQYDPQIIRKGANAKLTVKVGANAEAYVMANYFETKTSENSTPLSYTGATAAGGTAATLSTLYLPAYVCAAGVGTLVGTHNASSNCTAANGTLNPNNPFAAAGNLARIVGQYDRPRQTFTDATTFRLSAGINGTFGNGWAYDVQGTTSSVALNIVQKNYIQMQDLLNAVAQGTYNFVNPNANSEAARQLIAPDNFNHSISKLTQLTTSLNKDFFKLPGGMANVAVGGSYLYEAIHNPSANPANNAAPANRYYSINAVGADGARHEWAAYYEVSLPLVTGMTLKADGRYDKYSSGQSHFSPKFEATYQPIKQLKLRGTYTQGFRVPSFNEAYGLPTTGYVNGSVNCSGATPTYAAFCAAHAGSPAYYTGYSYGLTSVGNPALNPETSKSYTLGMVLTPTPKLTLTADYWAVKVSRVIIPALPSQALIDAYYLNNGVVNIPGFIVTPGVADPNNPNALPTIGTIQASYQNADAFDARGVDLTATLRTPIGHGGTKWISKFDASYLSHLSQTDGGTVSIYDGTLSPCNTTSCSGAPKWRFNWQNKLDFNGKASLTATAYYTGGYSEVSTDLGGIYGDCAGTAAAGGSSVATYFTGPNAGNAVLCNAKATFDLDLGGTLKIADRFTLYGNIQNVLNSRPPFDPGAAYGLYSFNPAWGDKNFIGRYFKVGVKLDF